MRSRYIVFIMLGVAIVFGAIIGRQLQLSRQLPHEQFVVKKLRVLTYSSFVGSTGPGSALVAEFKGLCQCDVDIATAGDAGLILERLKLVEATNPYDVVIGLDQIALTEARKMEWKDLAIESDKFFAIARAHLEPKFVPLDWSPMTFIYREGELSPPQSLLDLTKSDYKSKIAIQDPRSSSPGLQLVQWVRATQGEKAQPYFEKLKPNVASVSPSWSFSYGLFKKKQADLVFSYVTSLAYHWGVEKDRSYRAAEFAEGHPVQVEFAAIPNSCRECDLGQKFVQFLIEPTAQKLIMEKNYMFPVRSDVAQDTIFGDLPQLKELPVSSVKDLSDWLAVFK